MFSALFVRKYRRSLGLFLSVSGSTSVKRAMPPKKRPLEDSEELIESTSALAASDAYPREEVKPKPLLSGHNYAKIITWNVNGFKALAGKNLDVLKKLVVDNEPDLLFLQETKLQESQVADFVNILDGYESRWNCSVDKKGYAGTAVFFKKTMMPTTETSDATVANAPVISEKKKQSSLKSFFKSSTAAPEDNKASVVPFTSLPVPLCSSHLSIRKVSFDFSDVDKRFAGEGRTITVELNEFYVVACYVPNSGEGLVRLNYRTKEWDPHMRHYLKTLNKTTKSVVFTGDLNVGHEDVDIYNPEAKHIAKQAGLTPEERQSHTELLQDTGFVDAFRYFHADKRGQFTYWSQRTFARPVNKGIRLDSFICSPNMFDTSAVTAAAAAAKAVPPPTPIVFDCYSLPYSTVGVSDHCPVVLVLQLLQP